MPLIQVTTSEDVSVDQEAGVMQSLSQAVCEVTGKSEEYLMVLFGRGAGYMAGRRGAATFVDVRAIGGLGPEINIKLSAVISGILHDEIGASPENVYINFLDIPATDWGWNNRTFGS